MEGFWPEFYAHGRFLKYSMSASSGQNNEVSEKLFFPPKPEHDYVTYEPNLFLCFLDLVDLLEDVSRLGF